jgi:excisionase family DNA binding protein
MHTDTNDPLKLAYSIKEACKASSLGRTTLYSHIAAGRLLARRIGGRTVIPAESLHALIAGEA